MTNKINYEDLRKKWLKLQEKNKTDILSHDSIISKLIPGQFNYCFQEDFLVENYGGKDNTIFLDLDIPEKGINFSKIQPVIRDADFENHFLNSAPDLEHLVSFDLASISGGKIGSKEKYSEYVKDSVNTTYDFLINNLGLDKNRLYVTYYDKGNVNSTSKGKFDFKQDLEQDTIVPELFKKKGLPSENLIANSTRDNFLMIDFTVGVGPWGYRNEILYKMPDGRLLDIATIEHLKYRPEVKGKREIVGLKDWEKCFVIDGFGIERVLMAANEIKDAYDLNTIKPLYEATGSKLKTECIRAAHRVLTDSEGYENLSKDRKRRVKRYMKPLTDYSENNLKSLLEINANAYPCYPELKENTDKVVNEIMSYKNRMQKGGK